MPVELRKRPAPKEDSAPAAKRSASKPRATTKAKQVVEKAKVLVTGEASTEPAMPEPGTAGDTGKTSETVGAGTAGTESGTAKTENPTVAAAASTTTSATGEAATTPLSETSVGKTLPPPALSTQTTTHTGEQSTLSALLTSSTAGVVIFTYPKASTPGCTTQACLFRDNYEAIRAKGYDVYGLSNDSEKANTGFKTKQNLQYVMLCDPDAKVTGVLGMKKPGAQKGTLRGAVVLAKHGEVKVWFQGGPPKTVDAVKSFLGL